MEQENNNPNINLEVPSPFENPPGEKENHKVFQKAIIFVLLLAIGFVSGMQFGKKGYTLEPKSFKIVDQSESPKVVDYQLLWDAINTVNEKYIEKKPTPLQFLYGAVKGAVESTDDPYTTFFEPKDLENFKSDLKGSFEGIGAEIGKRNNNIVVVAPLEGAPAKRAGLLPNDIIYKVNGELTTNWSTEEAVSKIRGPKGTIVTLTIIREGRLQPFDVKITREKIEIKSVKWEFKDISTDLGTKKIAIITISKFGDDTQMLFEKAVTEVLNRSTTGIIVDLRNNPGGYLQTAVDLASAWIKEGEVVVTEEKSQGEPNVFKSSGRTRLGNIKTLILINGGSASASEILAGALRDHQKAQLIGEKSFGKGSVQELINLRDNTAVKVTVARWITPSGKNLNKEGLQPDIEIKLTEENINKGEDPQMNKALEEIIK